MIALNIVLTVAYLESMFLAKCRCILTSRTFSSFLQVSLVYFYCDQFGLLQRWTSYSGYLLFWMKTTAIHSYVRGGMELEHIRAHCFCRKYINTLLWLIYALTSIRRTRRWDPNLCASTRLMILRVFVHYNHPTLPLPPSLPQIRQKGVNWLPTKCFFPSCFVRRHAVFLVANVPRILIKSAATNGITRTRMCTHRS